MNLFLGSIYPQSLLEELTKRKQFVDYPANVFQFSLLKGLGEHIQDLRVVTSPVIKSSYSEVKDLCKGYAFSHSGDEREKDIYVGMYPVPGIQMIVELWRVYWAIHKLIKDEKRNVLFIYALHSPFLLAAVLLKRKVSCSCVIVPDLPEFMSQQDSVLKKFAKKIDRSIINFCVKRLDTYALLSSYMIEKLPMCHKPWVLMEGIFDAHAMPEGVAREKEKVILYSGNLSRRYGITELLDAFHQIDKENYRLWICGRGDGEADILEMAKEDNRIKFFGVVSHDEVLRLQQRATVLINPRSSEGEYTKYSFPSKTMEYLASGTPTIMCHLPAIPAEYDSYIYYIEKENAEGIKEKLIEVCEKSQQELDEFGAKASEFIKNQKSAYAQAQKVVDMIRQYRSVENTSALREPMIWIKMALVVGSLLSIWAIGAIDLNIIPLISMTDGILTSAGLNKVFIGLAYSYLAGIFVYFLTVQFPQYAYRRKIKSVLERNINEIGSSLHNMLIDFCGGEGEVRNPNLNNLDDCRDLLVNHDWSSRTVIPSHLGRRRAQAFKDELDSMMNHINIFVNDYKDVLSEEQLLLLENIRHTSLGSFVGFGLPLLTSDFSIPAKKMLAEQFCDLVRWYQQLKEIIR